MFKVGERVAFKGEPAVVRFVGNTEFSGGIWVGLELSSQSGKNDGSINNVRYFQCKDGFGVFVRENMVEQAVEDNRRQSVLSTISEESRRSSFNGEERLKSIVYKLQDKLKSLNDELASLKASYGALDQENKSSSQKTSKLEEDLEILMIDKETLEEQNELFKQEIQSLIEKNQDLLREIETLKQLKSIDDSAESLITKNIELEKIVENLQQHALDIEESFSHELSILKPKSESYESLKLSYERLNKEFVQTKELVAELQLHIESSNQSTELVDNLTNENLQLQEDKKTLLKQLEEFEDLNKVEADLEKIRLENEDELKEQIDSLEALLDEKDLIVDALELKIIELENTTTQAQPITATSGNNEKVFKNQLAQIETDKSQLELKLSLLSIELKNKEQLIKEVIDHFTESSLHKTLVKSELQKFYEIYRILPKSIPKSSSDSFIQLLSIEFRYSLDKISCLFKSLLFKSTYSSSITNEAIKSFNNFTNSLIEKIKDQDYTPIEFTITSELISLQESIITPFDNRQSIMFRFDQQSNVINCLFVLIDFIQSNNVFEDCEIEIKRLFKVLKTYQAQIIGYIKKLDDETEKDNEINQVEIKLLDDDVLEFFSFLRTNFNSLDFQSSKIPVVSYLSRFNNLISEFGEVIWESNHVVVSQCDDFSGIGGDSEIKIKELEQILKNKDTAIEELEIKIGVFKSRLTNSKELSTNLKYYKDSYEELLVKNEELNEKMIGLIQDNRLKQDRLSKLEIKKYSILNNDEFNSMLLEKQNISKVELLSKLQAYENVIRYYSNNEALKRSNDWLKQELSSFKPFQYNEFEELRKLGRDLRKAVENSTAVTLH